MSTRAHDPVPSTTFSRFGQLVGEPPPLNKGNQFRRYELRSISKDLVRSGTDITAERGELEGEIVFSGRGLTAEQAREAVPTLVIEFLLHRVFVHHTVELARIARRELELQSYGLERMWRIIDRHVLEGLDWLNTRA